MVDSVTPPSPRPQHVSTSCSPKGVEVIRKAGGGVRPSARAGSPGMASGGMPRLFDGADSRATSRRPPPDRPPRTEYPMYVLPVPELLRLDALESHQALLKRGALVQAGPEHAGRLVVVSHEWLGSDHPDPANEHLRCLQAVLRGMLRGAWGPIGGPEVEDILLPAEQPAVEQMLVWLDFWSVPQPAIRMSKAVRALIPVRGESTRELWRLAVGSIPAYLGQAALMLVLAPVCRRGAGVADYGSWRRRGWCRFELAAAMLARLPPRVMLVRGGELAPTLICPLAGLLAPGGGSFSCCECDHRAGLKRLPCDRSLLRSVVERLMSTRAAELFQAGQMFEARYWSVAGQWLLEGLPPREDKKRRSKSGARDELLSLDRLRQELRWAETEAEPEVPLLVWAVLGGHVGAVKELCWTAKDVNFKFEKDYKQVWCFQGDSVLALAMRCSSPQVAESLLEAKADPGPSVLASACRSEREGMVGWWLKHHGVNKPNAELALAVSHNTGPEVVHLLLGASADPCFVDSEGNSILSLLCLNPNASEQLITRIVKESKVDVNGLVVESSCCARVFGCCKGNGMGGMTALHLASLHGQLAAVQVLVDARADCNARDDSRFTPLERAESMDAVYAGALPEVMKSMLLGSTSTRGGMLQALFGATDGSQAKQKRQVARAHAGD